MGPRHPGRSWSCAGPRGSPSSSGGTRSPPPSATTRSSWWRARRARARARSSRRSASRRDGARPGSSATPSPAGWPPAPSPSGWPRSWAAPSAASSGYTVRFTDRVGEGTRVKVMTDGILLAELQRDRLLSRYDTLIVDEAHERSLNIDFILGYLKQLLPRRPDLKVVVTSATIDTERFAAHFGGAPVVEVTGRTYPVEVRYRPVGEDPDDDRDQISAICDAARGAGQARAPATCSCSSAASGRSGTPPTRWSGWACRTPRCCPLYARLSAAEQHRVFRPHPGRRVVLATNVAETSLTVPGIRSVVDPGTARISRYNRRTKVQRLPIEPVSQASADQRAGRCGRVGPGTCIRLYSEDDYLERPRYTEPEVLRTNLASVILQMTAIGLGDVAAFPFVEPPDARSIADGMALLEELGALEPGGRRPRARLTPARAPAGPAPGRPPARSHGAGRRRGGLRGRGDGHRRRPVHPGPPGAPTRQGGGGGPGPRPLRRRRVRLPALPEAVGAPAGRAGGADVERLPAAVPGRVRQLAAGAGVAGRARPAPRRRPLARHPRQHAAGRARRHPPRPAVRPPVPRRHPRRPAPGLPRCPLQPLRHRPRLRPLQEPAGLGGGGRAGGDHPPVGPGGGPHRAAVGRGARRPPGEAQLRRAVVGCRPGRRRGVGAGHALRHPHRGGPQRPLRPGRPGGAPARCSCGTPWSRASGRRTTTSCAATPSGSSEVRALEDKVRRRDLLVDEEGRYAWFDERVPAEATSGPRLRPVVAGRAGTTAAPPRPHGRGPGRPRRRRRLRRGLPRRVAPGRPRARPLLRVRPGRRPRRRDRRRAPRRPRRRAARRVRLAGAGAAGGPRARPHPLAAQGRPPIVRARRRARPRLRGRGLPRRRAAARRRSPTPCAGAPARSCPPGAGTSTRCPPTSA